MSFNNTTPNHCGNSSECTALFFKQVDADYSLLVSPVTSFMCLLMLVGIVGNVFVITLYGIKRKKTSTNIAFMVLGVMDLLACVVIHPYVIYKLIHHYSQSWVVFCKIFEFLIHANLSSSIGVLVSVSIDRYYAICKPMQFHMSHRRMFIVLCSFFGVGVLFSIPILEFYGTRHIPVRGYDASGYMCDYSDKYNNSLSQMLFGVLFLTLFIISVCIIVVMYTKVALAIYRRKQQVRPIHTQDVANKPSIATSSVSGQIEQRSILKDGKAMLSVTGNVPLNLSPSHVDSNIPRVRIHCGAAAPSAIKMAKVLFLVTAVFLFSWLPFWILKVTGLVIQDFWSVKSEREEVTELWLNHLFYLNNVANPIIYAATSKAFRQDSRRLLQKLFRRRP